MFSWDDLAVSSSWYPDSFVWKCSSAATRLDVQGQLRQVERYDRTTTEERDMIGGVVKQGSGKNLRFSTEIVYLRNGTRGLRLL